MPVLGAKSVRCRFMHIISNPLLAGLDKAHLKLHLRPPPWERGKASLTQARLVAAGSVCPKCHLLTTGVRCGSGETRCLQGGKYREVLSIHSTMSAQVSSCKMLHE